MLPNFLIIGAAKSATTWLAQCLDRQPDIFVHDGEIRFFSCHFDPTPKGINWYKRHFKKAKDSKAIGEKANDYLYYPLVPERIKKIIPNVKLIALLRNPIERAYSDYCMQLRRKKIQGSPVEHLDPSIASLASKSRFLEQGLYYQHLNRYFRIFPREQMKIFLLEDVKQNPVGVIREILEFLNIEESISLDELLPPTNTRDEPRIPDFYKKILRYLRLRRVIKPFILHTKAGRFIKRKLSYKTFKYPEMSYELKQKLKDYYEEDISKLSNLLNRELEHWLFD